MNEERKPWDQLEEESNLWYGRFRAYLLMGFKRSVNAVFQLEAEESLGNPRGEAQGHWYEYAKKYRWEERAKAYDTHWIEEQDKLIAQEREIVLRSGYALMHKRIEALNKLADKMVRWADEDDKVWLIKTQDVTGDGFSKHTEETVFNAPMLGMIEKYFDGIAKEKGERVKKQELTGRDGDALEFEIELVGNKLEEEKSEG
jgi:hypothetical protein